MAERKIILVVDDEAMIRDAISSYLENQEKHFLGSFYV